MIYKSTNPLSPDVNIKLDNVEIEPASMVGFVMSLDESKHDMCALTMRGIPTKAITDYIDVGVRVSISNGPGRRQEFCGYVAYVEPISETRDGLVNDSPFQTAKVVCMGASYRMAERKTKVWTNASIGIIAQIFARQYSFSLDCATDPFAFPRLLQQDESDWAFLIRICAQYGYRVTVHGTHMHIFDPMKAIGRLPSLENLRTVRNNLDSVPGAILSMRGTFGFKTPHGSTATYQVAAMDASGNITTVKSNALDNQSWAGVDKKTNLHHHVTGTAQSTQEAIRELDVLNKQSHPFNAVVEVTAGAGMVPGGVVNVTDYNSDFDGLWYVRSVEHNMGQSQYITTANISRDFNEVNTFKIPNVELAGQPPEPKFVNGMWMSSDPRVYRYDG